MIKTKYFAKLLAKARIPSFEMCNIDKSSKVNYGSTLVKVKMGRYSYVGAQTSITDAVIGQFCSIGSLVNIGGGVHPTKMVSTSPAFLKGKNFLRKNFSQIYYKPSETVFIGNDVWIGNGSYIKSGIKIGDGAIIGAHAVVTHDVDPFAVVVGVPARTIYKRFDEDTISRLLDIKWWDWSNRKLEKYGEYFETPEKLFEALGD